MTIKAPRYPVWSLWSYIVASKLGYSENEAKSLAIAVANLNAASKFYGPSKGKGAYHFVPKGEKTAEPPEVDLIPLLGRKVYVIPHGPEIRAILHSNGKAKVILPDEFDRKVIEKLGDDYTILKDKLEELADCFSPAELNTNGYRIYAKHFAPTKEDEAGQPVWKNGEPIYPGRGKAGIVDFARINALIAKHKPEAVGHTT
jgi:hypothetical protein